MLFKPKWEHKDPRVRARAAAEIDDPRLLEMLPELAASDPDPAVRLQAAKRVTDIHEIQRLAETSDDAAVRDFARRTFRTMLAGNQQPAVALAIRMSLLAAIDEADLIEHLAQDGAEDELRLAAVERVTRPALLGDIALGDANPKVRRAAAARIDSASTLERVADKSRTLDKRVHKIVTERLTRLRLEAGDPAEMARQAAELCQALEQLTRADHSRDHKREQLERLVSRWDALGEPPSELTARFIGARRILEAALASSSDVDARHRGEIEHYLADCAAHVNSTDLDLLQRSIDQGEALQRRVSDAGDDARLAATVAALIDRRQHLITEQAPAPELIALCERAEKLKPERIRDQQIRQLESAWDRAWAAIADHRPADQSVRKRFDGSVQRLKNELARRAERRAQALARLEETLTTLEQRLEQGDLSGAVKSKQRLLDDLDLIGAAPEVRQVDFKSRLNAARRRLYELRDWQHWANNKIRARLCEEAEAIAGSGMHPDAVAEKVKGLHAQWRELEDSEHLPGDDPNRPANPGLRRRFQAACNRAFLPAKDYFKKRAEIREKHLDELEQLCEQVEAVAADTQNNDYPQLERIVARARSSLRKLGKIPPRERSAMSKRLREGAAAIDQRLDAHYQIIERKKQRLIDEVTALADEPDLGTAITAAKEAQRHWQQAGRCRRRQEQKLWGKFRAACDRVFERLDQRRSEQRAERQAQNKALHELLAAARQLLSGDPAALENAGAELNRLQDQWRRIGGQDRRLETEFLGLVRDIEQAQETQRARRIAEHQQRFRDLALLCQDHEQRLLAGKEPDLDELQRRWTELAADAPEPLARRATALLERGPDGGAAIDAETCSEHLEQALELCVRMEFLAGVETPAEYRDARMNYQVQRLAQRMSGAEIAPPREEAAAIEQQWLGCGPLPADQAAAVSRRFLRALEAFGER